MIDFITFCDYTGTFAFAISGIRLASAKQFDWFGAYVVGVVTAVGGGTLRDVLLTATPFWMKIVQVPFLMTYDKKYPGVKPLRTYSGPRYVGGVSDHCPIVLCIYRK